MLEMETTMMIKKRALLIAVASTLALGAVTPSFAQQTLRNDNNGSYYRYAPSDNGPSQYGPNEYVPGFGNVGAGSGPGGY